MRNILVFPDGTQQDFMYPQDRDIEVGTELQVTMMDDSVHRMKVSSIEREEKRILYRLTY
jgi:hypothetical protein